VAEPVDLVLHIGWGKTGTSSIQNFLAQNRDHLAELGFLYPRTPGRARHGQLGVFIRPDDELPDRLAWQRQNTPDPAAFRKRFRRRLFREINESGLSRVLMSDEELYDASSPALRRLRRFSDRIAQNLRLVVYLRRQDDHLVSSYQQRVKVGEVRRIDEWELQNGGFPPAVKPGFAKTYDYHARLRAWHQQLAPTEFVVRRFERNSFVEGSLFQDFLDAAGIAARADELQHVQTSNESLSAEAVEFLRLLNIYRVENEGATGFIENRRFVARLVGDTAGPILTLPANRLDAFMERWEASNRAVARQFIGDPSGELFRTPRNISNTTTEQCLDPARVDQFVDLLELPEEWRGPLRRLAEGEAARR
jgi:hypothetical protein